MRQWWEFSTPLWLQNGVARVLCWFAGHERGRSNWCDWCGKDMDR